MQDIKPIGEIHEQEVTTYVLPKITVYKKQELLQTLAILGCSPN